MSISKIDKPVTKTVIFHKKIPSVTASVQNTLEELELFGGLLNTVETTKQEPTPFVFGPQRISESTGLEDLFSGVSVSGKGVVGYSFKAILDYHLFGRLRVARRAVLVGIFAKFFVIGVSHACGMWLGAELFPLLMVFRFNVIDRV